MSMTYAQFEQVSHTTPIEDVADFIGNRPEPSQKSLVGEYLEGAIEWLDNGQTATFTGNDGLRYSVCTYRDLEVTLSELISNVGEDIAEAQRGPDEVASDNGW
jgi:hypothetical protein